MCVRFLHFCCHLGNSIKSNWEGEKKGKNTFARGHRMQMFWDVTGAAVSLRCLHLGSVGCGLSPTSILCMSETLTS